jgi:KaiC/GvpD/RAD55 family RecA-like ATPase
MIEMENIEVFPGSKILVRGNVPSSSIVLIGSPGVGKTTFCKQFLFNGLVIDEPCIYVTTQELPEEIENSMKAFGFNIEPYKENKLFRIVDGCSWKTGVVSSSEYAIDGQQNYLTSIWIKVKKAQENLKNYRLVIDSVSEIIAMNNPKAVLNFLQILTTRIRSDNSKAIFTLASGAQDEQFMNVLRLTFDGILEMKIDESKQEISRLLRIFSLKGVKHHTAWTPFEITDKGLIVKRETELRCTLCSRLIDWEPIAKVIDGKECYFDTDECWKTYRKFKSVSGDNFE